MNIKKLIADLRVCADEDILCTACDRYHEMKEKGGSADCVNKLLLDAAEELEKMPQWIPVTERLPDTIPCDAGTAYSEAVNVLTDGRKVLTAIWNGLHWICDAEFWDAEFEEIRKYIRFVDGMILLGEVGNELELQISNDRISFLQDGAEVAYFSNRKLYVTDTQILHSLQLGNFAFMPRDNGNLSFKKI